MIQRQQLNCFACLLKLIKLHLWDMTGGASYLFPKFLSEQHLIVEISSAVCSPVILNSLALVSQTGKTEKRKHVFSLSGEKQRDRTLVHVIA